ncbi:MAG: histidine phosphatase family protein [Candidatus Gastranaerophilales bacterium]|nr:histidine phosphatase family protein [Candidatus Gastranaerophilales bacterium]
MFNRLCKIIFIRHGATSFSEENRLYDSDDYPPLNELGKEETEKITKWLKQTCPNVDKIYTSSALRSIQSARMIAKNYKQEFEVIEQLQERKSGIWGGLTYGQIQQKYPDLFAQYKKDPTSFVLEGAESRADINKRVGKIIGEIIKDNPYKTIFVITHAGVVQSAISSALRIEPIHQNKIYIPTGSATQISYFNDWASLVYSGYVPL